MSDDGKTDNELDQELDIENDHSEDYSVEASSSKAPLVQASSPQAQPVEPGGSGRVPSMPAFVSEAESSEVSASQTLRDKTYAGTENASSLPASGKTDKKSPQLRLRKKGVPIIDQHGKPSACEDDSSDAKCEPLATAAGASSHPRYNALENEREAFDPFPPGAMPDVASSSLEPFWHHRLELPDFNHHMPATRAQAFAAVTLSVERTAAYEAGQRLVPHPDANEDYDNEWLSGEIVFEWTEEILRYITCFYYFCLAFAVLLENDDTHGGLSALLVLWVLFYPLIFAYM